jgi:NAD(P)-dependent dehydrogenase (short-subunit alcohol dehydrogenase family)
LPLGNGIEEPFMSKKDNQRRFSVVTGASSGMGRELASCRAEDGFDLLIAADEPAIEAAVANATPASVLAARHRKMAEPGSARKA